ncbi:HAD family hydrolase [Deminuibacter soli]|uniref:phosphoglycolate phosphatase n=1 Tax=Deminuibacter soli TaxID=2291815 RepID=A0A3E1NC79_9BACT|nr:HAD hydrolase-like protein [Deminuibacter soli]RFM25586.1 HAD family hydrolase [Deminuibacter soli]
MLNNFTNILWDFDGVIMDSNPIRDVGFEQIFASFPKEQVDALMVFHRNNGGLSRFVKIRYFFEEILHKQVSEATVQEYADSFSTLMRELLLNKSLLIADSLHFIQQEAGNRQFHLVSASAQDELHYVSKALDIDSYFISIVGSPASKTDNVQQLLQQYGYHAGNTCLIGDSHNDAHAAAANHIPFFGYHSAKLEADERLGYVYSFREGKYREGRSEL